MKIKVKIRKPNMVDILYDDKIIKIDLKKAKFIDGYMPIISVKENTDETLDVTTTIIDEDLNVIVPIRTSKVSKESFKNYDFDNNVVVFKNKKAIYKVNKDEFYLINLKNVTFYEEEGKFIPSNSIFKMTGYYLIDSDKIIVYAPYFSYIYDVCNNVRKSMIYNFIEPSLNCENMYFAYYIDNENTYSKPLIIQMLIDDHGGIFNEALVNDSVLAVLPNCIIGNKIKTIRYCDDCYNTYIETYDKKGMIIQ